MVSLVLVGPVVFLRLEEEVLVASQLSEILVVPQEVDMVEPILEVVQSQMDPPGLPLVLVEVVVRVVLIVKMEVVVEVASVGSS